ncbi:MAG: cell division protein SepF [Candidatus Ornithomonoglobus sp.]
MSLFSDTKAAFSSSNRDYEEDYDREYEDRYSRRDSRSYSRYDEPEEQEDYYYDDEEDRGWHPLRNFFERKRQKREERLAEEEAAAEAEEEERRARSTRRTDSASRSSIRYDSAQPVDIDVELVVFYPQTIDDSDRIVEAVQSGKLVMFIFEAGEGARNAEAASDGTARRIVDYVGGAAKGMNCGFGRLSNGIFCIAPKNVKIPQDRGRRRF